MCVFVFVCVCVWTAGVTLHLCVCVCVCVFTGVQGWLFTESEEWARRAEEHYVIAVNKVEKIRYFVLFIL